MFGNRVGLEWLAGHLTAHAARIDEDAPYQQGNPDAVEDLWETAPWNRVLSDEVHLTLGSYAQRAVRQPGVRRRPPIRVGRVHEDQRDRPAGDGRRVREVPELAGERGRRGRQRLVYAFWGITPASVDWVQRMYRSRFGIESSDRQINQAKVMTTTRNPVVRLFLIGVALVLRNVWEWLHWEQLSMPRRGGRVVRLDRLPFKALLLWLLHVVEERFGCCDSTRAERTPRHPLAT